ncbi:nucleotide exchange factor GrpE [Bacillus kwashiorkori]|uniref:nucleotide exchange factor GrpE n=1 Tax=Bacillus kwashiorkori TaxID=1522318 RepID=UPI000781E7FA
MSMEEKTLTNDLNQEKNTAVNEDVVEENMDTPVEPVFLEDEQKENENKELEKYQMKIAELEKLVEEKENRLLRVQADFENFKRRSRSEKEMIEKYRSEKLASELLPAIDNFERALQTEADSESGKALLEGMEMIYRSILTAFEKEGIKPIEAVGKEFDPNFHHAVMQGNDENKASNIVLEEFQKGYLLNDKVIRPSMVKVNQ